MEKRSKLTHQVIQVSNGMRLCLGLAVLMLCGSLAMAQLTQGTLSGVVRDETGAVIPGVDISISNVATGVSRSTISDDEGRFTAPNLASGEYQVRAELAGFRTTVLEGIGVTVGQRAVVDLVLQIGEVTDSITVSGAAALLETSTATISGLVSERKVLDLPLNNRDLTQLTYLQPGVLKVASGGDRGLFSGQGDKITVAGARGTHNIYLLDGVSNSDLSGNAQGASGSYIGAETVKEFQIITNSYSAEYESKAGAIISAITKSGTNEIHGSLFEFLRNDNLDATNFFDNSFGNERPEFKRNQFGFSLGGPVVPDRTHWFTSYEGLRERLSRPAEADVPFRREGDPNTIIVTGGTDLSIVPIVQPYAALYPFVTDANLNRDFGDGNARIVGNGREPTNDDFFTLKVDHVLGEGALGNLSGNYTYDDGDRSVCDSFCAFTGIGITAGNEIISSTRHTVGLRHTSVLSVTTINEFAFGFSFTEPSGEFPLDPADTSALVFVPGRTNVGQIDQRTRTDDIGFRTQGQIYNQKTYSFKDGVSMNRGSHAFKAGGQYVYAQYNQFFRGRGTNGIYRFDDIEDFAAGDASRFEALLPGGDDPDRNFRQHLFGFYFQDDWRATPNLTLNLGLRYEFVTVPTEVNDKISNLVNLTDPTITEGVFYTNGTKRSFSPRLGFAWAIGDTTTLRGGAGIFYVHPSYYHYRTAVQELPPFTLLGRKSGCCNFPNDFDVATMTGRPNVRPIQFEHPTTYMYRWSLNLQQAVGSDWVLSAGYTGSRGLHLLNQNLLGLNQWEGFDLNNPPSGAKVWPFTFDSDGDIDEDGGAINDSFADIRMQLLNANSYYHGLQLGAQKRFSEGLSAQLSYSFARAVDQGSGVTSGGDELPQTQRGIYGFDMQHKQGLSSHHIANYFSANFSYELPVSQNLTGAMGQLANGWQLNSIITLADGHPLSITDASNLQDDVIGDEEALRANLTDGGDNNPFLGGPDQYYDPSQFLPSQLGRFGTVGRNTLIGPGLATVDFSLFKTFDLGEDRSFQFRAEFFNIMNRANFGDPDTSPFLSSTAGYLPGVTEASGGTEGLGGCDNFVGGQPICEIKRDSNAGRINRTTTSNRQIQFGLKFVF